MAMQNLANNGVLKPFGKLSSIPQYGGDMSKYYINVNLTIEPSTLGRINVKAKDEILDTIKRQQQFGQITLDI